MKTTLSMTPALLACTACLTTTGFSQWTEIPRMPSSREAAKVELLKRYDKNKDGKLGEDEVQQIARDRMLANDTNKDGRVDQVELKKMRQRTRRMPPMDAAQRAFARERDKVNAEIARKAAEKKATESAAPSEESGR